MSSPPTQPKARPSSTRPPDASMSLLLDSMRHPLDPGYAAAAQRRAAAGKPGPSRPSVAGVLAIVLVGVLLATGAAHLRAQRATINENRAQLVGEIQRLTAEADRTARANEALRAANERAQASALGGQAASGPAVQARTLSILTGDVPVRGPGVTVRVDDAPDSQDSADGDPRTGADGEDGRVLDRDLQILVNGLWAAGAEAVAVNGQRLTALSAIRGAGEAILVDYRPLNPPYVMSAVGEPGRLESRFASSAAGAYLTSLENFGVRTEVATVDSLTLPASSSLRLRAARPSTPATGSPTGTATSSPSGRSVPAPTSEESSS